MEVEWRSNGGRMEVEWRSNFFYEHDIIIIIIIIIISRSADVMP